MLDISFQPEDKASVTIAEKLVVEYFLFFKNAACTLSSQRQLGSLGQVATLSWDAIIAATKDSIFFEANPKFFENHTPDLVCASYPLLGNPYANAHGIEIQAKRRT